MAVARMGRETAGELLLHPNRNRSAQTTNTSLHPDEKQTLARSGDPWEAKMPLGEGGGHAATPHP